ncbi:hypothetical protein B0H15DRAFT_1000913 [Mycena belliarum]|uniref:DUF6534 domain-containing protein n=1 Tax=Mycena belliarum TaxID=1033014 RepID=A0AAD6TYL2_9AGAR|nr:hypothetical protein B0H15DRAFT_1000913 [Mycena belliae]
MAAPPPALPNVQLSYGPMLIGVFLNMILYGVLLSQVLTYFQVYKMDATWLRVFLRLGQKPLLFPTVFMTEPLCVVLVSMPIQIFFAWRIHQLNKSPWIPLAITVLALASFAGGIWTATMVQILRQFAKKPLLHNSALLWFLASCVADVLITVSLVLTLTRKKTGFAATDSVLDKIIRTTIQTGMITAIFSILDVACFMALPHYAVNFVWDLALSKLYSNCLMSTLNARQRLNNASHSSTFQQQRNVVLSPRRATVSGKDSFLDTSPDPTDGIAYDGSNARPGDLEYGINMTKIVERMEDPVPCGYP